MLWTLCLVVLTFIVTTGDTINKPVYKIALAQKGYAQFLQYDVETPPLREFTFCIWVRVFTLDNDQSIFTYVALQWNYFITNHERPVGQCPTMAGLHSPLTMRGVKTIVCHASQMEIGRLETPLRTFWRSRSSRCYHSPKQTNGNNRVVRLWLDTGGRNAKISIDERILSNIPVDFEKDSWRHVCLSYQSDHGAWALYIDSRLASCEAAQNLHGHVLPGGGSIIVGYGIANNGIPNGLEGEIFGVNMILTSSIERNYSIKSNPQYKQKSFHKNKVIENNNLRYTVLGDMNIEKNKKRAKTDWTSPPYLNESKSYIKFKTPYSFFEHDVGQSLSSINTKPGVTSTEQEIWDLTSTDIVRNTNNDKTNFWKIINEAGSIGKFKNNINSEISTSGTQSLLKISEYETPPHLNPRFKNPVSVHNNRVSKMPDLNQNTKKLLKIEDTETPPPPSTSTKVYGKWTSSQFASSVLNYLKSINFNQREHKKVPSTIPLLKISDAFPYASEIKVSKVLPSFKFQRSNFIDRRLNKHKRDIKYPDVQILQNYIRHEIIKSHAQLQPKYVEVTNRGQSTKNREHRFYREVDTPQSNEDSSSDEEIKPKPFSRVSNLKINKYSNGYKNNKLLTILPFLKSLEYYTDNLEPNNNEKTTSPNDVYLKSLSNGNKWHNVKSYSNDYTPRQVSIDSPLKNNMQEKIAESNKKLPSIRLKYKAESQKLETIEDDRIIQGRNLASDVSNQSNQNIDSVSLIKYNYGFLPSHDTKILLSNKMDHVLKDSRSSNNKLNKSIFHKQVKLGNALNEQNVIGNNEKQNKQSFLGGVETIPDVNRYRSDIDHETGNVPPSLRPRICKNVELYDRLFYVQPDGSIDVTHILSPVREKNTGIEFIMQNYKTCSLENSDLDNSPLLFIDWKRTPVRLFGGAYPKKTTDLCGFF